MGMLETRLRILSNNSLSLSLSPQDIVECSKYSQGCDGGFPYLIAGKYAEDFGAVPEYCNPYKGKLEQILDWLRHWESRFISRQTSKQSRESASY